MGRPKILLFGSSGQLGGALASRLDAVGSICALDRAQADFRSPAVLQAHIAAVRPDVIVNAAAYTQVDRAEAEADLAEAVNVTAVAALATAAKSVGALLVHYSTDYVFDGSGQRAWLESDATGPLNVYGQTKLRAEAAVVNSRCEHLIIRVSWLYGARGHNFLKTLLRRAGEQEILRVVDDQVGAPTSVDFVAEATATMVRATLDRGDLGGIYHVAAKGETSWHGYAELVVETVRAMGLPVRTRLIERVSSQDYPTAAVRPRNSRLDTTSISQVFGIVPPDWRHDVVTTITQLAGAI